MLARIADDVGHGRALPSRVDVLVALAARRRSDIARRRRGTELYLALGRRQWTERADEQHEPPRVAVLRAIGFRPCWYAGQSYAVLHDLHYLPARRPTVRAP